MSNTLNNNFSLMLFDLSIRGHHPIYIQHLLEYWYHQKIGVKINLVVSPLFLEEHQNVVALAHQYDSNQIKFIPISSEEESNLKSRKSKLKRLSRNFQEWQIFSQYAQKLKADHSLLMYFDTCELPLAFKAPSPCPFSGIYFRPTFHYNNLKYYHPSFKDRIQQGREKLFLSQILQNPNLKNLFCLDPFVVQPLSQFKTSVRGIHLPDPVQLNKPPNLEQETNNLREHLGIEPGRKIFLLFGALTERKGIYQLLEAISLLPSSLCQKISVLLVGESRIAHILTEKIKDLCTTHPVQIIQRYEFITEQEIQPYFHLSDIVLALYQKHVGMSGILLLAAAAQKPVLSSNYGLMGEVVRRYQLGLTVESTSPLEIAQGLRQFLEKETQTMGDLESMKSFAEQNSAEKFAEVIFSNILPQS